MSVAILDLQPPEPSAAELMERALEPHLLVGMPHLTPRGLSETWAMKELGHRHWLMLARHLGMENADFRTPDGREAYAAICATSLRNARFEQVRANDVLTIRSSLVQASRTQTATLHRLAAGGMVVGEVELVSAFVYRAVARDNHSLARVPAPPRSPADRHDNLLAQTASALRGGRLQSHLGIPVGADKRLRDFLFEPEISQEFNGAGLFYFAQFQALVERALDCWFPGDDAFSAIARRDVFFFGNLRPGEAVEVGLAHLDRGQGAALCNISRRNGDLIGRAFVNWSSRRE